MKEKDSEQAKLLRSIRDLVNSMGNPSVRMQRSHSSISNDTASTSLKRPRADSITQIVSQHVAAQVDPVTAVPAQIEINYRPAYEKRISIGSHGDDSVTASSAEPTPSPANDLTLRLGRGPYPPEPISHINRDSVVQYSELIGNFPDKPRSFLLPQSTVGPLQSLAFSSTIKKNELSVWDLSRNRSIHTFSLETEYMPEDMVIIVS